MNEVSRTGHAFVNTAIRINELVPIRRSLILCFAYIRMFALRLLPRCWVDLHCEHTLLLRPVCNFISVKIHVLCAQLSTDFL